LKSKHLPSQNAYIEMERKYLHPCHAMPCNAHPVK
jgi:hypothetical protein